MLPNEVRNYLSEIGRLLRPQGRCLITFFLLNAESKNLIEKKLSSLDFRYDLGTCWTTDKLVPEAAIAYEEAFVRAALENCRLTLAEPIHYGAWCGRKEFLSYQDIVVGVKRRGHVQLAERNQQAAEKGVSRLG